MRSCAELHGTTFVPDLRTFQPDFHNKLNNFYNKKDLLPFYERAFQT